MKLQQNKSNGQYYLNLPKELIKAYGWEPGNEIRIQAVEKLGLVLRKE